MEPYVHSEHVVCVRDSEGTFEERRGRLGSALQQASTVTRAELMQRNIMQGVNVIRRGARALEGPLARRPSLQELVAAGRLPADYLDRAFPSDPADSVAPLAERIERVSLHRLLAPPASSAPPGRPPGVQPGAQGQLDPAALAAMVVRVAMMSPRLPEAGAAPLAAAGGPATAAAAAARLAAALPTAGLPAVPGGLPAGLPLSAFPAPPGGFLPPLPGLVGMGSTMPGLLPPQRPPKPSLQAQRTAATAPAPASAPLHADSAEPAAARPAAAAAAAGAAAAGAEEAGAGGFPAAGSPGSLEPSMPARTPFVRLLDEFCDKVLGPEPPS